MGCFLSTNASSKPHKTPRISNLTPQNRNISKSPPPTNPLPEEEAVKEVLSETRAFHKSPSPRAQLSRQIESPFIKNAPLLLPDFARNGNAHRNGAVYKKPYVAFVGGGDDVSEDVASEICSTLGESESVSTEKREEEKLRRDSPVKRKNAAFSGEMKRDKTVGRSPGRRSEPSPGRARAGPGNGRRDSGESSGRRSRSPVARTDSGPAKVGSGRSPSTRKTVKSPGRVGSGLAERTRKLGEERRESGDKKWPPPGDESLENPLVSLECFIFL